MKLELPLDFRFVLGGASVLLLLFSLYKKRRSDENVSARTAPSVFPCLTANPPARNEDLPPVRLPFCYPTTIHHGLGQAPTKQLRCVAERHMDDIYNSVLSKDQWWVKVFDEKIVEKWGDEVMEQLPPHLKPFFTRALFDRVIVEIRWNAENRVTKVTHTHLPGGDHECLIRPAPIPRCWVSDDAVPAEVTQNLLSAMKALEEEWSDDENDNGEKGVPYHPQSKDQVINYIHPSLHCAIANVSRVTEKPIVHMGDAEFLCFASDQASRVLEPTEDGRRTMGAFIPGLEAVSKRYQWLPADVSVDSDSHACKICSYVNNLRPVKRNKPMYDVLEQLTSVALPLLENALKEIGETVVQPHGTFSYECPADPSREALGFKTLKVALDDKGWVQHDFSDDDDDDDEEKKQQDSSGSVPRFGFAPVPFAEPKEYSSLRKREIEKENTRIQHIRNQLPRRRHSDLPADQDTNVPSSNLHVDLRGRRLQIIYKVAKIELTPENSKYAGGTWHIEGMENESIVATAIYYAEQENITGSSLGFRGAAGVPNYCQGDEEYVKEVFGIKLDDEHEGTITEHWGKVQTTPGRLMVFPNYYQHCVSPFELADNKRKGHRTIVVMFVVNPKVSVLSTAWVPPISATWQRKAIKAILFKTLWGVMDVVDHVSEFLIESGIELKDAKSYRLALMEERGLQKRAVDEAFETEFSLCEH